MVAGRTLLTELRRRHLLVLAAGVAGVVAAGIIVPSVERLRSSTQEIRWLRVRLTDKRAMIEHQQAELTAVSAAVDRLARDATALRERHAQVRRLAHMEETREFVPEVTPVAGTERAVASPEAASALEKLAWLDGQLAATGDSIAVLTALLADRPVRTSTSVPSIWPVHGLVTSVFGSRVSPLGGGREMHPGIDIQGRYGLPVTAGGAGEVIFAGRDPGYGNCVILDHGKETRSLYGHLSAIYVREGQHVRRGQPLGALGASGRATGAHLHYEVRVAGRPVDPRRYLVN